MGERSGVAKKLGKAAVEPLITALNESDSDVRDRVALVLAEIVEIGDTRVVEPLIAVLKGSQYAQMRAAKALEKIGKAAVEPLINTLKDSSKEVRARVCLALGRIGDVRAVEPLTIALKDNEAFVRRRAAEALIGIGDARAVEPLIAALGDSEEDVRKKAAEGLRRIGKAAVEPLVVALKNSDTNVRSLAAMVLAWLQWEPNNDTQRALHAAALSQREEGKKPDAAAIEPLIAALKGNDRDARGKAVIALREINGAHVVEPLIAALKDSNKNVRWLVAENLGLIGDARAVEPLATALKDRETEVRENAAAALGRIGDARAVEPLIAALKDTRASVRRSAVGALGKIGDMRAVKPLTTMLKDEDSSVRSLAAEVLEKHWVAESKQVLAENRLHEKEAKPVKRRIEEAQKLVGTGDPVNLPKLLLALDDESSEVRRAVISFIWQFWWTGDLMAIGQLIVALKDSDNQVRATAAEALGKYVPKFDETPSAGIPGTKLRRQEALNALVAALNDPDQEVARLAAAALANIQGER